MTQGPGTSSTVQRWQLGETLRQLREQGFIPREVEQLLDVYSVADTEMRQWLTELASTPRNNGWVTDIRKYVPDQFHKFLDWESALTARRQFETLLIPGLLQTADYARSVITGINPGLTEEEVERRILARTSRQQLLRRAKPPELHVILDAELLERQVGTAERCENSCVHWPRRLNPRTSRSRYFRRAPERVRTGRTILHPDATRADPGHRLHRVPRQHGLHRGSRRRARVHHAFRCADRTVPVQGRLGECDHRGSEGVRLATSCRTATLMN